MQPLEVTLRRAQEADGRGLAGDAGERAVEAREIAQKRQRLEREAQNRRTARGGSLEDISRALAQGQMGALRLIIKADQGGPADVRESIADSGSIAARVCPAGQGAGLGIDDDSVGMARHLLPWSPSAH